MKKLTLSLLAASALLGGLSTRAHAAFTLTLQQVGNNVVASGAGSFNTTALTLFATTTVGSFCNPSGAYIINGGATTFYRGIAGPAAFGPGSGLAPTTTSGSTFGIDGGPNRLLFAPEGYVSGAAISGVSTYANQTFATLGVTPGTYTYTWGSGANADSFTVTTVVPEPSTWAALATGVLGAGAVILRRRAV